ncbi:MAG: phosphatidylglycerophosphatase A, partial [Desulfobacterales bacterium]|nr:phosphatidylglycerophosphatase A [Desulfobacterales bacterium]
MTENTPEKIEPYKLFLSAFGMGFMPFAPGTWGSLWAALIPFAIALIFKSALVVAITLVILFVYGFWATIYFGDKGIENYGDDPGMIVSDEVCGQSIALFWLLPWHEMTDIKICYYFFA